MSSILDNESDFEKGIITVVASGLFRDFELGGEMIRIQERRRVEKRPPVAFKINEIDYRTPSGKPAGLYEISWVDDLGWATKKAKKKK